MSVGAAGWWKWAGRLRLSWRCWLARGEGVCLALKAGPRTGGLGGWSSGSRARVVGGRGGRGPAWVRLGWVALGGEEGGGFAPQRRRAGVSFVSQVSYVSPVSYLITGIHVSLMSRVGSVS